MLRNFIIDSNDYEQIDSIGEGGCGQVDLVRNKKTKKEYALKSIIYNDETAKYIMDEIEINSKIKYPTIFLFIGFGQSIHANKIHYKIFTEYLPNGNLRNLFTKLRSKKKFKDLPTKKYIILLGIVLGMKYLHSNNFIHRDLKPTNILLDNDFYPRICDFGLSRESNKDIPLFIMNSSVGHKNYMAHEMKLSKRYNFKVDIYSFSIILFELITGKQIFDLNLINGDENKEFIKKCHSKNPSKRPTFVEIENFIRQKSFISLFGKVKEDQVEAFEKWIENCQKNNDDENKNNENNNDYDNKNNDNDNENNDDDYEYEKASNNNDEENEEDYYNSDLDDDDDDDNENDNNDQFILFKDTQSISYKLYTRNKTAQIVESSNVKGVFIPTFINYSKQKYKINDICDNAFKDSHITSLSFANDSCVKRIDNNVFHISLNLLLLIF